MTRVLLLATSPDLTKHVESLPGQHVAAMDQDQFDEISRLGDIRNVVGTKPEHVPDMIILGDGISVGESLAMAQSINSAYPDVQIVLVAEPDTELVMSAMRVGIRDIVSPSVGQDELKVLLHRASGNVLTRLNTRGGLVSDQHVDLSRVIVVASPKGGVGRSTVATNVAVALAKTSPMDTVLVDLDLQFGNAATMLNLDPVHTIADAFESTAAMDTLILKTFLTVHPSGFYVLCAAESPTISDKVTPTQIKHLITQLSSQFRYIVVDTAAGLAESTLGAMEAATDLVLVSSMDVTSTRAMRKEIKALSSLDLIPASSHVVLNFADRHSGVGVREVEAAIGLPVDVVVPRSFDVQLAGNLGEALMEKRHGGPVAKSIRQLVTRIHADEESELRSKHRGIQVA